MQLYNYTTIQTKYYKTIDTESESENERKETMNKSVNLL
jgi:hypothetical protein